MYCENYFCVYQADGRCCLEQVHLDITGSCTECIYIELDKVTVTGKKSRFYEFLEKNRQNS